MKSRARHCEDNSDVLAGIAATLRAKGVNRHDDLLPVGSKYDRVVIPGLDWQGSDCSTATKFTYEVEAHVEVVCIAHGAICLTNKVRAVASKKSRPREVIPIVGGGLMLDWAVSVRAGFQPPPVFD